MNEKKGPMYNIGEVARILGLHLGKNQLYAFLKQNDIIDNNNSPYQEYINKGLFEKYVKVQPWNGRAYTITLVTEDGLSFIMELVSDKKESLNFLFPKNPQVESFK